MRNSLKYLLLFLVIFHISWGATNKKAAQYEIVIVGATFSGIAAAINAAQYGHSVALVEEYDRVGGLMTNGLSFTDFISFESLGGTFLDYTRKVEEYYIEKYGKDAQQVKDCHFGIHAEPHVTELIFKQMLNIFPNIKVFLNYRIEHVSLGQPHKAMRKIKEIRCLNLKNGERYNFGGDIFIDATYEGDLAAFAGANYRIGRESREKYGEPLAGHIYYDKGKILNGSTGEGDNRVQGYNFRVIMTNNADNRLPLTQPKNYNREEYLPIIKILNSGEIKNIFTEKGYGGILRTQMIPNQKADVNDIKNAPVRIALLGENYAYPDGTPEIRAQIIARHQQHILGLIYFLQYDTAVDKKFREDALQWGLAKDEFMENNNFPPRLYIREARRTMGKYIFTQNDVTPLPGTFVIPFKQDAIAIGDYALNCHGVQPPSLYPSIAEGDYNFIPPPFQIPFGVIVPNRFDNLLVSVAISSSHVGFTGIRLEPVWTALGQAAGLTAHLALQNKTPVTKIPIKVLQALLHQNKAKTSYISDIDANSPIFEAAQFLALKGYLQDVYLMDTVRMAGVKTYKSLWGTQYAEAYPFHDLEPDKKITEPLLTKWINRISEEQDKKAIRQFTTEKQPTRGELLMKIYECEK
ncbi:MAG: FAD-dependent oxidoreductase [Bacteroidota bacterium]